MKQKLFITMFVCLVSISTFAYDFEVDGIYYKITDNENKTVAVTYKECDGISYSNDYSGSVIIPNSIIS